MPDGHNRGQTEIRLQVDELPDPTNISAWNFARVLVREVDKTATRYRTASGGLPTAGVWRMPQIRLRRWHRNPFSENAQFVRKAFLRYPQIRLRIIVCDQQPSTNR